MTETKVVTGGGEPVQASQAPEPSQAPEASQAPEPGGGISWTASEFVAHEKSGGWYGTLMLAAAIVAALIYLSTRDVISTVVVIVAALVFAAIAGRKPRQLQYQLNDSGIVIGHKQFAYTAFKSFTVVPEGAFSSIVFRPLKRFAPLTTIYYAPADEEKIVNLISQHLPLEEHKPDAVDNMMRRIRF